jgi:hypothetical protein
MKTRTDILKACEKNEGLVDQIYSQGMDACWTSIEEAAEVLAKCSYVCDHQPDDEKLQTLHLVLVNCVSDLTGALMLVRQAFTHPAFFVLRPIFENLACVAVFGRDDVAYSQYQKGTYNKPKAIVPAKKYLEAFGPIYGMLTNLFSHEGAASIGRAIGNFGEKKGLTWVPPVDRLDGIPQYTSLINIGLIANLVGEIGEWLFATDLTEFLYWEKTGESQLTVRDTPGKKKVQEIVAQLAVVMQKREKSI